MNGTLTIACPSWKDSKKPCHAWGAPAIHGCKKNPGHEGRHVCPCGTSWGTP